MPGIQQILKRWTTSRYTRMLESEVARLRAENRALLNSILGVAGIPPITVEAVDDAFDEAKSQSCSASGSGLDAAGAARLANQRPRPNGAQRGRTAVSAPFRRRTWYQVLRALEFEAARKKERESADAPAIGIAVKNS